jgi:hypothetical protein
MRTSLSVILACSLAWAEETRIEGDDSLRQLVLDAIVTNKTAVANGHWRGSVVSLKGCVEDRGGKLIHFSEMRGDLELIWQGENVWAKYQYHDIDRFPPLTDAIREEVLFVEHGQVSVYHPLYNAVYSVNTDPGKRPYIPEFTKVGPEDLWYKLMYGLSFRWEDILTIPYGRPNIKTLRMCSERTREGMIRIGLETDKGGKYAAIASERNGLQIVEWSLTSTLEDTWIKGSCRWEQTAGGAWYPARLESKVLMPVGCRLPSEYVLVTESFTEQPEIAANQFQWRAHVPQETHYEIKAAGGKTLQAGTIGQPRQETPEEVLRRLGSEAREGFALPPGAQRGK